MARFRIIFATFISFSDVGKIARQIIVLVKILKSWEGIRSFSPILTQLISGIGHCLMSLVGTYQRLFALYSLCLVENEREGSDRFEKSAIYTWIIVVPLSKISLKTTKLANFMIFVVVFAYMLYIMPAYNCFFPILAWKTLIASHDNDVVIHKVCHELLSHPLYVQYS